VVVYAADGSRIYHLKEPVGGALYSHPSFVKHVGVDHHTLYILVFRELLNSPDVMIRFQVTGGKGVAKYRRSNQLMDPRLFRCFLERPLQDCLINVMPLLDMRSRIDRSFPGRKDDLPTPVAVLMRVLSLQGLVPGGGGNVLADGKMTQKLVDFPASHFQEVAFVVKQDESPDPLKVSIFRP